MKKLIKQYTGCLLEYDEANGILIQTWNENIRSFEFRQVITESLQFFIDNRECVSAMISDTRNQAILSASDLDWVLVNINPQLAQNGCRKMAFVASKSIIIRSETDRFKKFTGCEMETATFATVADAVNWIRLIPV